ncbi:MAG: ATP-binding cassette domain-containing protein [Planctomycetes bacterium]|nr:ATP-binding cassette domain-containing protein [Planctomycetota bacterium]
MSRDRAIVKTVGLTKVFKDFWRRDKVAAVQDLNLEVRRGEVFGLLGPNGSGKSTTIKMLLGLLYPTRGRISLFGRPPTDVATKARIGFLPEESYLYRFLNARETLQLYAKLFRLDAKVRASRIDKLLEMVGLQHQAKRRIGEYSKGMARRIGLAQALINDPDFLILDEPTTGLDPIGTRQIKELIRELASRGKTVLLSSHLLSDVQDVCDRFCILYGGRVQAVGDIDELLRQQGSTQITAPRLKDETIEEITQLIRRRENKAVTAVEHPTERLEHFFVRIVEEAQASRVATAGVQAGGEVPDFLSEEQGETVVETLVSAADQPTAEVVAASAPDRIQAQEDPGAHVLSDLMETAAPAEQAEHRPQEAVVAASDASVAQPGRAGESSEDADGDVDRGVIDALLDKSEDRPGG